MFSFFFVLAAIVHLAAPSATLNPAKLEPGSPQTLTTPFAIVTTVGDDEALQVTFVPGGGGGDIAGNAQTGNDLNVNEPLRVRARFGALPTDRAFDHEISSPMRLTSNETGWLLQLLEPDQVSAGNWYAVVENTERQEGGNGTSVVVVQTPPKKICEPPAGLTFCGTIDRSSPVVPYTLDRDNAAKTQYVMMKEAVDWPGSGSGARCGDAVREFTCARNFPGCGLGGLVMDMCQADCVGFAERCMPHFSSDAMCNLTMHDTALPPNCLELGIGDKPSLDSSTIMIIVFLVLAIVGVAVWGGYRIVTGFRSGGDTVAAGSTTRTQGGDRYAPLDPRDNDDTTEFRNFA